MKARNFFKFSLSANVFILTLFITATIDGQDAPGSLKLSYSYPADNPVRYMSVTRVDQTMDVNGQSMLVRVVSTLGCSVRKTGDDGNNLVLNITIDTLAQTNDSPGGITGGTFKEVIGKAFTLKILPSGKETDLSGAEQITYTNGEVTSSLAESFRDFFPDVPENALYPGYTWKSSDTVNGTASRMAVKMVINSENKYEGTEHLDGVDCAKISFLLSGNREMKTRTQGIDLKVTGPFTGNGTMYFAVGKGYFVRHEFTTRMSGTIEISSPEAASFPVLMEISSMTSVQ